MNDTETKGRIIKVGNPNRLVKYAQKHPEEDYFFNEYTGDIREGGHMVSGGDWYYITGNVFPIYENGAYIGAKWFNNEPYEISKLLRNAIFEMHKLR